MGLTKPLASYQNAAPERARYAGVAWTTAVEKPASVRA
jgi:hypothetical protein